MSGLPKPARGRQTGRSRRAASTLPEPRRRGMPRQRRRPGQGAALTTASCQRKGNFQRLAISVPLRGGQDCAGTANLSAVNEAYALDDREWFANHPDRHFRAQTGGNWICLIRRLPLGADPDVFLRTYCSSLTSNSDTDSQPALLWCQAAYPTWSPGWRKWARKVINRSGG